MRLYALAVVTIASVVLLDAACDRVPLTAPTASTINVTVDQTTLPLNGQATVRAVVIESGGTPVHNGTQVTFATTLGSFAPPTATTVDGVATTTFLAGSISGSTKINAYSGGASTGSGNSSSGGVTVLIGAAAAKSLAVSATPSSVSQSGGTVTIAALVMDESGNPLPGVNVTFSSDVGQLNPVSAISDATGYAKTQLQTTQTAKVTAIAGAAKGDVTVSVSAAPTIGIDASDGTVGVPVPITVTLGSSTSTNRQISTLTVEFGDGQSETRTNVTGNVATTHTYQQNGGYTITARATDVAGNTAIASKAIRINYAPIPSVTLTASKTNPTVNETITMTVTPTVSSGGAPIRSVIVRSDDGTVLYSGTGGGTFPVTFTAKGARTVTATVTDAAGQSGTTSTAVIVQ